MPVLDPPLLELPRPEVGVVVRLRIDTNTGDVAAFVRHTSGGEPIAGGLAPLAECSIVESGRDTPPPTLSLGNTFIPLNASEIAAVRAFLWPTVH